MNVTVINEAVKVGAVFEGRHVVPKWFCWRSRKLDVKQITCSWQAKEGEAVIIHFSAADGMNLYELGFNKKTLEWRLLAVEA